MAKNDKTEQQERTGVETLNDTLTNIEQKVQNNSRPVMIGLVVVIAIVCLVLFYFYGIRQPGINKANDAIGQADVAMVLGNDSVALAQYQQVADNYGYAAGNRAKLNTAILLYQKGDYQQALAYLAKYKASDKIIASAAKSLEGDCYVNLDKLPEALKCYQEAVAKSDDNPAYTPTFLMKEATVYRAQKNYAQEQAIYQQIVDEYPDYGPSMNIDMESYLERAKLNASAK